MRPVLSALVVLTACGRDPAPPTPTPATLVLPIVANGVLDAADPDRVAPHDALRAGGSTVALVRADQADVLRGVQQAVPQTALLRLHVASGNGAVTAARVRRY